MSRLESLSPMVIAWAVALGLGGLLLVLLLVPDEIPEPMRHAQFAPAAADVDRQAVAVTPPVKKAISDPASDGEISDSTTGTVEPPPQEKTVSGHESDKPNATSARGRLQPKAGRKDVGKATSTPVHPVAPAASAPPVQEPPKPEPPKPEPPKPEPPRSAEQIQEALRQPVLRFSQEQPVSVKELLREIEELAGVELRLAAGLAAGPRLARKLKLDLERTTVDGILGSVLKHVGLTHKVHDGYVLVTDATSGAEGK